MMLQKTLIVETLRLLITHIAGGGSLEQLSRKEYCETLMTDLDKKINLLPELDSKYMGIKLLFPQSIQDINMNTNR